ncbi:putative disease resistance protein RGA3 [Triticum dicoccoides]|uniref:putative disease resistance protein RGA3 n=1 Tax=Triticum dicoccoides TaxID=85692 RepID=UPI000E7B2975|nr:putative disease resistance protein RGA3 [Triticum dicoccoides]XP_037428554.1 putative disease resistance protein RGA3 [Triticum dicoccoides]XP_037428555.1 putative disease resistance protein RGA3 [Triticum dicoccoides]XP_037428556.1 putative disease resistance protein RGA3 [Triticum dicoccoides]
MAGVLDALASYVTSMLPEMAKEEVAMLIGVSDGIKDLNIKLGDLKNFLADADRRNITDESVRGWVGELKRAMYLATDIVDLCQLKAMEEGQTKDRGCLNPLLFCMWNPIHTHDIGTRIKLLNQNLDDICKRGSSFNFIKLEAYHDQKTTPSPATSRKTDSLIERSGVVGEKIEEDTRALVEVLTREVVGDKNGRLVVVAIVGIGGIGKTTLGKKVFNDEAIEGKFTKKIWLSITQDFTDVELLSTTITAIGADLPRGGGAQDKALLVDALKNAIKDKKFFLVLDDMWDVDAWNKHLMTPFSYGGPGSRVLITTRHDTVARSMKAFHPYHHVDKLAPQDAWSLLKKQVLTSEENEPEVDMLEDIGFQIVAKCDGLPLAIKVMGGLLCKKEKTRRDWQDVLNDDIWSVSQMSKELNYAIYLSYQDLSPYIKQCFLHFSLKPKKTVINDSEIVSMWVGEGLVEGDTYKRSLEEGNKYYKELIVRNLIEVDTEYPSQLICNMHDVIRSFAQFVVRDETLVGHNGDTIKKNLRSPNYLRLSIETKGAGSDEFEWRYLREQKLLRSLILTGNLKSQPGDSLTIFPSLRLLHIDSANIAALVESMYQLKHLRYLALKRTDMCRLPENIHEMKFLQHICLEGCGSFMKLPDSIIKLQGLRFLDIDDTLVNSIPRGFRDLTNLSALYGFPAYTDGDWCSLEELGSLSQLNELSLESLENVSSALLAAKAWINAKKQLTYLGLKCGGRVGDGLVQGEVSDSEKKIIEAVFDVLCPQPCIEHIKIKGYFGRRLPGWMTSTAMVPLESLKLLVLEDLPCCTELPDGLCGLPYLEWLRVSKAPVIKCIGREFIQHYNQRHRHSVAASVQGSGNRVSKAATFPRLQKLTFEGMEEWDEWIWETEVKSMPLLEELEINACKLDRLPLGLMSHAMALKKLEIWNVDALNSLENFVYVVELDLYDIPELVNISNLPKLQKLTIKYCPELESLQEMSALRRLELTIFNSENELPVYLQTVKPSHLLLTCSLQVLTSMAEGESSSEWDKFSHIKHVEAYAKDGKDEKKWHVLYISESCNIQTNIHQGRLVEEEELGATQAQQ